MSVDLLYRLSEPLIAALILVLLIGATDVGYRAGARFSPSLDEGAKSQVSAISAGILGLLALLLGFTFAMAVSRLDLRKQLVTQEANAIGTLYLRSKLLPEPVRQDVGGLLRSYVDTRLEFFRAGIDERQLRAVRERTQQLHAELWSRVPIAVEKDDREVTTGLFIESLNEVIDIEAERLAATENHVPESVLLLLILVAVMAVFGIGYGSGLGGKRHLFWTSMLSVLLMLVIVIIMDLDRPRRGLIKVSQNSMVRLQESLRSDL
jgi:hypothetical protein